MDVKLVKGLQKKSKKKLQNKEIQTIAALEYWDANFKTQKAFTKVERSIIPLNWQISVDNSIEGLSDTNSKDLTQAITTQNSGLLLNPNQNVKKVGFEQKKFAFERN